MRAPPVGAGHARESLSAATHVLRLYPLLPDHTPAPPIYRLKNRFRPYGDSLFSNAKKVSKNAQPLHPGLAALDFPHSIIAPRARREGPSLAHRGSRGIHAAQPSTQRFRSAY